MKYYFSTLDLAEFFKVTRNTSKLWLEKGLMKSHLTEGGHRRVAITEVLNFSSMKNYTAIIQPLSALIEAEYADDLQELEKCWKFFSLSCSSTGCSSCLAYTAGSKLCFNLKKGTRFGKMNCKTDCRKCGYFLEFMKRNRICWVYNQKLDAENHSCESCPLLGIFNSIPCHMVRQEDANSKFGCNLSCEECGFFKTSRRRFTYCWELNEKSPFLKHNCKKCLVFKAHVKNCSDLRASINPASIGCSSSCKDCFYFNTVLIKKSESPFRNSIAK